MVPAIGIQCREVHIIPIVGPGGISAGQQLAESSLAHKVIGNAVAAWRPAEEYVDGLPGAAHIVHTNGPCAAPRGGAHGALRGVTSSGSECTATDSAIGDLTAVVMGLASLLCFIRMLFNSLFRRHCLHLVCLRHEAPCTVALLFVLAFASFHNLLFMNFGVIVKRKVAGVPAGRVRSRVRACAKAFADRWGRQLHSPAPFQ